MFLIKLATVMAFFFALLVICMLVKAIADQQKANAVLVRKNEKLQQELIAAENMAGLEADFEAILNDNQ